MWFTSPFFYGWKRLRITLINWKKVSLKCYISHDGKEWILHRLTIWIVTSLFSSLLLLSDPFHDKISSVTNSYIISISLYIAVLYDLFVLCVFYYTYFFFTQLQDVLHCWFEVDFIDLQFVLRCIIYSK